MSIKESLGQRRSYYDINNQLPVGKEVINQTIEEITELVPDAFNMKSARVVVAYGKQHEELWKAIDDAFEGKVPADKIASFAKGAGTILYYYDLSVVEGLQQQFPAYAPNFPVWANQANGMLQLSIWSALRELNIGASVQHYNPVIDRAVAQLFDIPDHYVLVAQMPFGGIGSEPVAKEKEDIAKRVFIKD